MYSLSSESLFRLIPEVREPLPCTVDDICPECSNFQCEDSGDHFYVTPPLSPGAHGFHFAEGEVSVNSPTTPAQNQISNYTEHTPHYCHAPPSTPITVQPAQASIQLWSSNFYKTTINFPPSELPEHLRDGAWCHMPTRSEFAILFGPDAALPFTQIVQSDDDALHVPVAQIGAGLTKFFWGPLGASILLPRQSGPSPSVEPQVRDNTDNTETPRLHETTVVALDSQEDRN